MRLVLLLSMGALVFSAGTAGGALAPGEPAEGCVISIIFAEPATEQPGVPEHTMKTLPCPVGEGAVVLFEDRTKDSRDPHNWSDVLVFSDTGTPPQVGQLGQIGTYVSDTDDAAGHSLGITDADLAAAGLPFPVSLLASLSNLVMIPESSLSKNNIYQTPQPCLSCAGITYYLISDSPEPPVPANATTWGKVKAHYH